MVSCQQSLMIGEDRKGRSACLVNVYPLKKSHLHLRFRISFEVIAWINGLIDEWWNEWIIPAELFALVFFCNSFVVVYSLYCVCFQETESEYFIYICNYVRLHWRCYSCQLIELGCSLVCFKEFISIMHM